MAVNRQSTVAELRNELDGKRRRALELQANTTDEGEWSQLNTIRWELEDLDKDLYLSQFIKNNDKLEKLISEVEASTEQAQKIVQTLEEARRAVQGAREKLKQTSPMFEELNNFLAETEAMLNVIRA